MDEEYFTSLFGKKVKISFYDQSDPVAGVMDGFLPEHDNEHDAILVKSEERLIEIKLNEIKSVQVLE